MEIFKLIGSIMVDSSEAESSLSKTDEKATSVAGTLSSGVKTAAKWGAAITTAAVAAGTAMVNTTKETAANADTVDKAAQRMNISAESYQELAYAAELSGVEMTTMEKAAKELEGTDLNLDDALDQLMQISDESERSEAAMEMFGETVAYKMTPLLNAGAEGLDSMKQEANDLGLVMSDDTVKAGAEMNDTFTKLEESGTALMNSIGTALMPVVNDFCNALIDEMPEIQDLISDLAPVLSDLLSSLLEMIEPLIPLIEPIAELVAKIAAPLAELLKEVLTPIVSILTKIIEWLVPKISTALQAVVDKVLEFVQKIKDAFSTVKSVVTGVWDKISSFFGGSSNATITVDGSHASGLSYVPYDGYVAQLHRGETVLNSTDSSNLLNSIKELVSSARSNTPSTITVVSELDGREIARGIYDYTEEVKMLRGATV